MPDTTVVNILIDAGVAGAVCLLFIIGMIFPRTVVDDLKEEVNELKQAVAAERDRADAAVAAAQAARDMMSALQAGIRMAQQPPPPDTPPPGDIKQ